MTKNSVVAILVTDTPIPGISNKFGDFGDNAVDLMVLVGWSENRLKKYYVLFEKDTDYSEKLAQVYTTLRQDIASGLVKGFLLTGSRSDSFATDVPWIDELDNFIKNDLFSTSLPIVGICFGHQIIGKNLGAKVGRNTELGLEAGTVTVESNSELSKIENLPFDSTLGHWNLVEFHQDIVHNVPPPSTIDKFDTSFINIGSSAKCQIQGLITERGPLKIFTVQGHPEFNTEIANAFLQLDLEKKYLDQSQYDKSFYNTQILNNLGKDFGEYFSRFYKLNEGSFEN